MEIHWWKKHSRLKTFTNSEQFCSTSREFECYCCCFNFALAAAAVCAQTEYKNGKQWKDSVHVCECNSAVQFSFVLWLPVGSGLGFFVWFLHLYPAIVFVCHAHFKVAKINTRDSSIDEERATNEDGRINGHRKKMEYTAKCKCFGGLVDFIRHRNSSENRLYAMSIYRCTLNSARAKIVYGHCTTRCNKISYNNDTSFEHTLWMHFLFEMSRMIIAPSTM